MGILQRMKHDVCGRLIQCQTLVSGSPDTDRGPTSDAAGSCWTRTPCGRRSPPRSSRAGAAGNPSPTAGRSAGTTSLRAPASGRASPSCAPTRQPWKGEIHQSHCQNKFPSRFERYLNVIEALFLEVLIPVEDYAVFVRGRGGLNGENRFQLFLQIRCFLISCIAQRVIRRLTMHSVGSK